MEVEVVEAHLGMSQPAVGTVPQPGVGTVEDCFGVAVHRVMVVQLGSSQTS